jgi:REP element-mobilizing transposase RayT
MATNHPPRLHDSVYVGCAQYFLTICCEKRQRLFESEPCRALVTSQLRRTSTSLGFAVLAYCLMPDHLHVVCEAEHNGCDFQELVRRFKQSTAFEWKRRTGERLWQSSYYDHVLRETESTRAVVQYLLENPVRAKLVAHPADYPHCGSFVCTRDELIEWAFGWNRADT